MPPYDSAPQTLLKVYGIYHLTRLQADKNAKELGEAFDKAQNRLQDKAAALDAAEKAAMRAMAVRDGEDEALDDTVRRFFDAVMSKCNNNRKSQLFLRYFPEGMAPVVNAPLENELVKTANIITKLAEEEDAELAAHAGLLSAAMQGLQTAMDAYGAAVTAEDNASSMVKAEKLNWLDTYKLDHRSLGKLYYKDPKKPDRYFKPAAKPKKDGGGGVRMDA